MTDVATTAVTNDGETMERALERISVSAPYFALENLAELGHGIVRASVPGAVPRDPETGAMEAAQVARHLAILGSCAAALGRDDNKRHHYLATRAHYTRLSNAPTSGTTEPLRAEAIASWVDRRTARSLIKLSTESGHGLNLLDVEYTVLAPKMFARLHPPAALAVDGGDGLDGADSPAVLDFDPTETEAGVNVSCGPIPTELCAGHFADYPAAPVAIVMGQLCRAAGFGLSRYLGIPDLRYRIEEGRVVATKLAAAGQFLTLNTTYDQPVAGGHKILGRALADGDVVGELEVILSTSTPRPEPVDWLEEITC